MKKEFLYILSAMALVTLTACNSPTNSQFLKGADVTITGQNNNSFVNLITQFDLGKNVSLAQLDVAINDPVTNQPRGSVGFSQLPSGIGQITLSVNVSLFSAANPALGQILPNGKPIPLALGANPGDVTGVPLPNVNNSIIYVGGDIKKTAFVGAALVIPGFDSVMSQLQTPANIFFMGNFSPSVMGVAGIFGSASPKQSGVAVFGKYTANPSAFDYDEDMEGVTYEMEDMNAKTIRNLMNYFNKGDKHVIDMN